ncbi:hypothetical protein ACLKA7_002052 [Drosophila subpalustris]
MSHMWLKWGRGWVVHLVSLSPPVAIGQSAHIVPLSGTSTPPIRDDCRDEPPNNSNNKPTKVEWQQRLLMIDRPGKQLTVQQMTAINLSVR